LNALSLFFKEWNSGLVKLPAAFTITRDRRRVFFIRNGQREHALAALERSGSTAPAFTGRSAVRRVKLDDSRTAVVRHYWHGGLFRAIGRDFLLGLRRPLNELAITELAREGGVPVPRVLAVRAEYVVWPFFRADIVTEEIGGATDLVELFTSGEIPRGRRRSVAIRAVAHAVRKMHDAGVLHGDLHLKNILLDRRQQAYIVDFDSARVRTPLTPAQRMRNLQRLDRSIEKLPVARTSVTASDRLRFLRAYADGDAVILKRVMELFRRKTDPYKAHRFFWRLGINTGAARNAVHPSRRPSVSACVITYNEEKNIGDCLESVKWADEIIVVDSFSTDDTLRIARRYTDRIFRRKWRGINDQRNFTLGKASCDWVLCIDADERISPELAAEIQAELERDDGGCDGFLLPRRNLYHGRWMRYGGWYPNYRLRLFRRGKGRFAGRDPHDHVALNGKTRRLRNDILHNSFDSLSDQMERTDRYSTERAALMHRHRRRYTALKMVLYPVGDFLKAYFVRLGMLDGIPGLISAATSSYHVFLKYAKLWELQHASNRGEAE